MSKRDTYHVVRLEHLSLVGSTISVQGECDRLVLQVLLRESDTSTDGDLRHCELARGEEIIQISSPAPRQYRYRQRRRE